MTDPISSVPATAPLSRTSGVAPSPADEAGEGGSVATTVTVTRAAHAPVYVYSVLDASTGRTLVQLPLQAAQDPTSPGARIDTTA